MPADAAPPPPPSPATSPGRALRWADGLLLAGLLLLPALAVDGLALLTVFLVPCCCYLSWVGYVAAWPVPRGWRWAMVAASALAAHALLAWMTSTGYLRAALVCGLELLAAVGWQRRHRAADHWFGGVALALWLAVAYAGLRQGSLPEAVRQNDPTWTAILLGTGANTNATENGQPVLHEALLARAGLPVIRLLLRHGADPNARWTRPDGSLIEPVAFAFPSGADPDSARAVLRLLLQAHLNPCQPDQHGENFRQHLRLTYTLAAADSAALALAERQHGCR